MTRNLLTAILALAGLLGYLAFRRRGPTIATTSVSKQGNRCTSTTVPYRMFTKRLKSVHWHIEDDDQCLDEGARVELRFKDDDSPLFTKRPRDKKKDGKRRVKEAVRLTARLDVYDYEVWYVSASEEYMMEDPEMQIEH